MSAVPHYLKHVVTIIISYDILFYSILRGVIFSQAIGILSTDPTKLNEKFRKD